MRCCFLLEALCVVGRQAFPPLSYILYPRFLAALADQSPKSSSSIWDAPIPSDTQWAPEPRHTKESTLGLCYFLLFHLPVPYSICSLPARTIHYSNTYANIFNGIAMPTSSVPMEAVYQLLSRQCGFVRKLKAQLERLLRYTEDLETKDFMQTSPACCDLGTSYFCTPIHMPCHSVDQVGLEPRPPLASHKLAFKACTSMNR